MKTIPLTCGLDGLRTMVKTQNWFQVDKSGLSKLMGGRNKSFILNELVSNAWDQNVTEVHVEIERGRSQTFISITDDDPEGFQDLAHAYTLFAESGKKANPEQRGRFNLGEKLVLALASEATIKSTKGSVHFTRDGRHETRDKCVRGSFISVELRLTKAEHEELLASASLLIPPLGIKTTVNGQELPSREPIARFPVALPTLIAGEDGVMRRTERKTIVEVYRVLDGEVATIYELGIPVVETGDKYHVNIQQKVLLNSDRDNVTPGYLRAVRTAVLNHVSADLQPEEATATWVREACSDPNVSPAAIRNAIEARFGSKAVIYDPSDPEANKISTAEGRQVVHGGSLTAGEWANVKAHNVLLPAGKVTLSPKPFSPDGKPLNLLDRSSEWTRGMEYVAQFAFAAAREILGHEIDVQITDDPGWPFNATYGGRLLIFNAGRLGRKFFENNVSEAVIDLVIHEFGHDISSDHLSRAYNDALTMIGAKMTRLAIEKPEIFDAWNH